MIKQNCNPIEGCGQPNILYRPFDFPNFPLGGGPPPVVFEAEYQAVLTYATTQGYTKPSVANQNRQNLLVKDLKAAGIWAELDIFYNLLTDGDANFVRINWKAPGTSNAVKVGVPVFTPLAGVSGFSAANYFSTYNPSTFGGKRTINSGSLFADTPSVSIGTEIIAGCSNGTQFSQLNIFNSFYMLNSALPSGLAGTNIAGLHLVNRSGAATVQVFINGVSKGNQDVASAAILNSQLTIGGRWDNGIQLVFPFSGVIAMFGSGGSLTGKELALYNAWAMYKANAVQPLEQKLLLVDTDGAAKGFSFNQFGSLTPDWFEGIPVDKFDIRLDNVIELKMANGFQLPFVETVRMFIEDEAVDLIWNGVDQYEGLAPAPVAAQFVVTNVVTVTLISVR